VQIDDVVHDGKPEAAAPFARAEEGVEDPLPVRLGDPRTRVGDAQFDRPLHARRERRVAVQPGLEGELAAPPHGLDGVENHVEEHLLQQFPVGPDDGLAVGQPHAEPDALLLEDLAGEPEDVPQDVVHAQVAELRLRLAGEEQQVGDLVVHAAHGVEDPGGPVPALLVGKALQEQRGRQGDAPEGVADLVGDVGRHLPHGGEFLRALGHLLELLDPGHVEQDVHRPQPAAVPGGHGGREDLEDALPESDPALARQRPGRGLPGHARLLRPLEQFRQPRSRGPGVHPGEAAGTAVHSRDAALQVRHDDPRGQALEDGLELAADLLLLGEKSLEAPVLLLELPVEALELDLEAPEGLLELQGGRVEALEGSLEDVDAAVGAFRRPVRPVCIAVQHGPYFAGRYFRYFSVHAASERV